MAETKVKTKRQIEPETIVEKVETTIETRPRPWWLYFLYAGTDVLSKVMSTRFTADGRDGQRHGGGVNVSRTENLTPAIDPERVTATTVIGESVKGSDGKQLGKVEEVAMDLTTGTVSYLVLSVGGILGFGDRFYAVPLDTLTLKPAEKTFYMDMDKKKLKKIPGFDKHNWPKKAV
jgi:sporulation protein YlmC with PRC-barrel domain